MCRMIAMSIEFTFSWNAGVGVSVGDFNDFQECIVKELSKSSTTVDSMSTTMDSMDKGVQDQLGGIEEGDE